MKLNNSGSTLTYMKMRSCKSKRRFIILVEKREYASRFTEAYKDTDSKLTDTKSYIGLQRIDPLKITNRKIYLNATKRTMIDDNLSEMKRKILGMKIYINKM